MYVWAMALLHAPTLHATRFAGASRTGLLKDGAFSIDDDEEGLVSPERHDPSKFAID